jgi:hypothetical protein
MGSDEAQNQEWLCWRGPTVIYGTGLEAVRCETVAPGKDGSWGIYVVGSRNQATASEDKLRRQCVL